ncbi:MULTISPECIES: hypothetical protein [unclassified Dysgonomonas]|uniref:hypothetical protein n=1 Tax=unclassified Dysgonomonas TaxID=2630389 RepID=UPI0013ED1B0E|nr:MULTISPECIES: hypothetical protein [unclassified Dysgonomonas]
MKTKNILLILAFFLSLTSINAQRTGEKKEFDVTKFKEQKAEFLKKELNLTDAEMKGFIPLVNEFMDKKFEINKTTRDESRQLRRATNKTEADYKKAIENYLDTREKEVILEKEYYQKFKAVLPAEKLFKYQRAEQKFMQRALEDFRGKREGTGKK